MRCDETRGPRNPDGLLLDPDRDYCIELIQKLLAANVCVEFHLLPGQSHSSQAVAQLDPNVAILAAESEAMTIKALKDAFTFDLRRPWVVDEYREMINAKLDAMS